MPVSRADPLRDRFSAAIIAGDATVAEHCARERLSAGGTVLELYEDLTDALATVGRCWETGEMNVADEHLATAAAAQLVMRLRGAPPHAVRGSVLLTTLPGERHVLGVNVLAHLLELARFRAIALGDVPVGDVVDLARRTPALRAVLVSAHLAADESTVRAAVAELRAAAPAATVIVGGPAFVNPAMAHRRLGAHAVLLTARDALTAVDAAAHPLTRREADVLDQLANGATNPEIAAALGVAESTVKGHVDSIIAKLDARSRTGAVAAAFRAGLLR